MVFSSENFWRELGIALISVIASMGCFWVVFAQDSVSKKDLEKQVCDVTQPIKDNVKTLSSVLQSYIEKDQAWKIAQSQLNGELTTFIKVLRETRTP